MFYVTDYKNTGHKKEDVFRIIRHKNLKRNNGKVGNRGKQYTSLRYLCELLDEYCKFSSLHGLRFIRDSSLPRVERFLWLGIFLTCLYISGIVVKDAYSTGMTNEFQLEYEPISTQIWKIPFPAVLVCSVYPIRKSVFDIAKRVDNSKFRHFSKLICSNKMGFNSEVFNNSVDEEFFKFMTNAAIPCGDLIVNCNWKGKIIDCCTLFKPIITHSGLCYVFNSLPAEAVYRHYSPVPGVQVDYDEDMILWDIEKGYPERKGRTSRVRPYWVRFKGARTGLTFDLVDVRDEWQETCSGSFSGFKVYVYPPDGFFETETFMRIPYNVHSHIKLQPEFFTAEESLRSVDVDKRDCLFKDELLLEYFYYYSQSACQVECYTKTALRLCGCIPLNSHRIAGMFGYPYCNDSSSACLSFVFNYLTENSMRSSKEKSSSLKECVCVPGCFWLTYDIQKSFQRIYDMESQPPRSKGYNSSQNNIARLSIYYDLDQFYAIKRVKTYDLLDILGNYGGLLGLLLGFSFMSLLEVIYFAILQPTRKVISLLIEKYKK